MKNVYKVLEMWKHIKMTETLTNEQALGNKETFEVKKNEDT